MKFKRVNLISLVMVAAVLGLGIFGIYQYNQKTFYYRYLNGQYNRAFYQLVDNMENMQVGLSKLQVAEEEDMDILTLTDIHRRAYTAIEALAQLPVPSVVVESTSKFLNQVGDYSYSLQKKRARGEKFSDTDRKNLAQLHKIAGDVSVELQKLQDDLVSGSITISDLKSKGGTRLDNISDKLIGSKFENIEKNMTNMPTLIYDGPFSAALEKRTPKGVTGNDVNLDAAEKKAIDFLGLEAAESVRQYSYVGQPVKGFGIEVRDRNGGSTYYLNISGTGGHVIWMLNNRDVGKVNLSTKQAEDYADRFLKRNGYDNMMPTYSMKYDNTVVINYAYTKDDVIYYPDLIKVKVALDNGSVLGFDALNYYMSHTERNTVKPAITKGQAEDKISLNLDIKQSRLAVIPLPGGKEALTYEFMGEYSGNTYYVYINAENGNEEQILQVIETDEGKLTM
ncbi:MAG: germination protein YpeB [Thermoanaerobacteraceae bacterium]|nr:germination protein YpeB [Thermoanaerobacteraceae bacterium]